MALPSNICVSQTKLSKWSKKMSFLREVDAVVAAEEVVEAAVATEEVGVAAAAVEEVAEAAVGVEEAAVVACFIKLFYS